MSDEELHDIIGKTIQEYKRAKSEFEAVAKKAASVGGVLRQISLYLQQAREFPRLSAQISEALERLPERKGILDLVAELDASLSRRTELYDSLHQDGIELRD